MARFSSSLINNVLPLMIRSGRTYASSATEGVRTQSAAASALNKKPLKSGGKITEKYISENNNNNNNSNNGSNKNNKKGFWMRDPRTGNWIPETHFDDVDVAELRQKLLSKNH